MLSELHITDFALIEELTARFDPGFTVLTGETGAGKSIIIDAINAILGGRTGNDLVRAGATRALIEAAFDLEDAPGAVAVLEENGYQAEDGLLLITREVQASGKSQCRINGRLATVSLLRDLGRHLIDVHGQHEHQSLLSASHHLDLLDAWAGPAVLTLRSQLAETYRQFADLEKQIKQIRVDERERARQLDLYQFQLKEIDAARLQPNEEEELETECRLLANAEKRFIYSGQAYDRLKTDGAVLDSLAECVEHLESLAAIDPQTGTMLEALQSAYYQAEDAAAQLRSYQEGIEFNPARLEEIQERQDAIGLLKRKYGDSIAEILAYRDKIDATLTQLTHAEEQEATLQTRRDAARKQAGKLAEQLTEQRREAAGRFAAAIEKELAELAMEHTRFCVDIAAQELAAAGADRVEFLISPNPGEPLRPLAKIASGGELSRVMLALKTILARVDRMPTLIFDEIDTGIGGRVAHTLAVKLAALGQEKQVICVTHQPQIASRAGSHFTVRKQVEEGHTHVCLRCLTTDERVEELSRMMGGSEDSVTARQHAREMLAAMPARQAKPE